MSKRERDSWLGQVCDTLTHKLFENEAQRLWNIRYQLVRKNFDIGGSVMGFYFKGILISNSNLKPVDKIDPVQPDLIPEVTKYLQDESIIKSDRTRIYQGLTLLLRECGSPQDIRDALPDQLASYIEFVKDLPRTREEAYTLRSNPNDYKQYLKIRDKIFVYLVSYLFM